ncbi:hypothetical protein NLX83_39545 [Allokutzneria sp. A3M-2-11 16]|uniref:hypothetical protein n=1 Tax=Allokutzneria sp. A3M-2-11 16 TaxID=2962043 RepID=UPI0020B8E142|nr:hypothetical protein [Allokutzneria sp. A3M-2-11 16]MCP3805379.1 hypothetical protein [Allokutzneria sp. A3M-2-11 16]
MPVIEGTNKLGVGRQGTVKSAVALYEFAIDGGAVGDIALRGDTLPSGAVIVDSLIVVDTALTSGGAATVAIKAEGAADINAADAISGAPWSTTGAKRGDLTATSAPVRTTAARTITATVGTAALTAGKFSVVAYYVEI